MSGALNATIPTPSAPLVDDAGNVTVPWRAYFLVLQRRTGGTVGVSSADQAKALAAEQAARIAGDNSLNLTINQEAATRAAEDDAEAAARIAADNALSNALANEISRAMGAESLLVPLNQLCSLWAACDLSFLPTTDPGGGKPWLDGGHLAVGTPAIAIVGIGLEDGTGDWITEDGTGRWIWG